MIALFVLLAGSGAVVRAVIAKRFNAVVPWGTLTVNLAASFLLGLTAGSPHQSIQLVAGVGGLGAFSTWSTLANEVGSLARTNRKLAGAYLAVSIICGVGAAACGLTISGWL